jgi:predicted DCC family thiol-disulfide oxidoreductase YuxK
VDFIINRDKKRRFRFASLQSEQGQSILKKLNFHSEDYDSFILQDVDGKVFIKSTAALKVCAKLGFPWNLLSIFMIVPASIRDVVYAWVAKNRYRLFGKKETCRLPSPEERSLFI